MGGRAAAPATAAVVAAVALLVEIVVVLGLAWGDNLTDPAEVSDSFGSPAEIGEAFLTDHLLAFEITSIVLLVAAIGGVVLGTTREKEESRLMDGPDVGWYLIVAAILFGIGALGVMLRRSPLIVLLSLEIMLNAANLTLDRVRAPAGDLDGQIFALAVMAVAAAEVAIGLGLIVAMARRRMLLDVDQASALRG